MVERSQIYPFIPHGSYATIAAEAIALHAKHSSEDSEPSSSISIDLAIPIGEGDGADAGAGADDNKITTVLPQDSNLDSLELLGCNDNDDDKETILSTPSNNLETLQLVRSRFRRQKGVSSALSDDLPIIFALYDEDGLIESIMTPQPVESASTSGQRLAVQREGQRAYQAIALLAGTYALSYALTDLLSNIELVQTWRYFWPVGIGGLFVWEGWSDNNGADIGSNEENKAQYNNAFTSSFRAALPFESPSLSSSTLVMSWLPSLAKILLGTGLIVGGAADALLPVYVTGPNAITSAGLAPDSAAVLFVWTLWRASGNYVACDDNDGQKSITVSGDDDDATTKPPTIRSALSSPLLQTLIPQMVLLAQLYKLGEGSFDEIFFNGI